MSPVAFGCWAIVGGFNWGHQEESDSITALRAGFDAGVNFFDTAEVYGEGRSEQLLAKALGDVRDKVVIASKVWHTHYTPDELRAACERSLANLGTDYIDLYQLHWPSRETPVADLLAVLEELKNAGKIRAYGISNFGAQDLKEALATGYTISSNQLAYNLLFRAIEHEVLPLCVQAGLSLLCYSPLMQGLLTGKYRSADKLAADRARTRHFAGTRPEARHGEPGAEAETFAAIESIRAIAAHAGEPMELVALAWLLAQPGITSVIAGARSPAQAHNNARAGELALSSDTMARLDAATADLKAKLGPNADMWQSASRIR